MIVVNDPAAGEAPPITVASIVPPSILAVVILPVVKVPVVKVPAAGVEAPIVVPSIAPPLISTVDNYNNFGIDIPAVSDELTPTTVAKQKELQEKYKSIVSS